MDPHDPELPGGPPGLGELVETIGCQHEESPAGPWMVVDGLLVCALCRQPWPGLVDWPPEAYTMLNPGYGELAELVPWHRRVDGMLLELADVEEERAAALARELAMIPTTDYAARAR
jgi:hypothetical protein